MPTDYSAYWGATCVRGVIALMASVSIAFCSGLNDTILMKPLGIVFSLLLLAAYIVVDSSIVLARSFMLPHHPLGRVAQRIQGVIGITIGIACFTLGKNEADLGWYLYLAALQACSVAVADYLSARVIAKVHDSRWCYAAAAIAALSSVVLMIFHHATGHLLSWLLFGYLGCLGLGLLVLSCHMLFRELHTSSIASSKWGDPVVTLGHSRESLDTRPSRSQAVTFTIPRTPF